MSPKINPTFHSDSGVYQIKFGCRTIEELREWEHIAVQGQAFARPGDREWRACEELRLDLEWQRAMFFRAERNWMLEYTLSSKQMTLYQGDPSLLAQHALMYLMTRLEHEMRLPLYERNLRITITSEPSL